MPGFCPFSSTCPVSQQYVNSHVSRGRDDSGDNWDLTVNGECDSNDVTLNLEAGRSVAITTAEEGKGYPPIRPCTPLP